MFNAVTGIAMPVQVEEDGNQKTDYIFKTKEVTLSWAVKPIPAEIVVTPNPEYDGASRVGFGLILALGVGVVAVF